METHRFLYLRLINGLRLAASPFEVQCEVLPDFVNLPDEVLNAVGFFAVPQLAKAGIISGIQAQRFRDYEAFLNTRAFVGDYDAAMKQLEEGPWFQELRERALALLDLLGERYERPTFEGVTYVKGTPPGDPKAKEEPGH